MIKIIWTLVAGNWIVQYALVIALVWGVYETNNYFVGQAAIEKSIIAAKEKDAAENRQLLKDANQIVAEAVEATENHNEAMEKEIDRIKSLPANVCLNMSLADLGLR